MADTTKLISLQNLTDYDTLIKSYIGTADAKAIKTVLWDSTNEKIKFYKKENATLTDTADYEVAISSSDVSNLKTRVGMDSTLNAYQSKEDITNIINVLTADNTTAGSVAKVVKDAVDALDTSSDIALATAADGVVTIKGVKETDGVIAASTDTTLDVTLAKVATTGKAEDVSVAADSAAASEGQAAWSVAAGTAQSAIVDLAKAEANDKAAIDKLNGDDSTDGSVAKSIKTAIEALDTASDVAIATKDATTNKVTIVAGVAEEDGKIKAGAGTAITLGTAANADVAATAIGSEGESTTALPTVGQVETYVEAEIAGLEGAMHFVGVITRNEGETDEEAIKRVITDPKSGDVVVMADNSKEYVYVDPDPETAGDEAWREIGDEGTYVKKSTTIAGVALTSDISKESLLTALNVADGAQVNVIESVKVNGSALTITDKAVDVTVAEGSTNGTVAVNGTDVAVHGLGSAAYTDSTAYDAAGKAQEIVDALNSTATNITETVPNPPVAVTVAEAKGSLSSVTVAVNTASSDDINGLFKTDSDDEA